LQNIKVIKAYKVVRLFFIFVKLSYMGDISSK
jgi:hypothetical protein